MRQTLHAVDLFAGAGGTSTGLVQVTGRDRFGLAEFDNVYYDILFRMLQPHELAAAMGFPAGYHFAGNREQRVKQVGNAVEVNQARALCECAIEMCA